MSNVSKLREDYAVEIGAFFDFLEEAKPAMFVSHALTTVLRTDPPQTFGPAGVADLVAEWSQARTAQTGESVVDLLLQATRNIVDAYNVGAVQNFRPREFYRQYRAQLVARCPEQEREILEAALGALQAGGPLRSRLVSAEELARIATGAHGASRGNARERAFVEALDRIREDLLMPEADFETAIQAIAEHCGDTDDPPAQESLVSAIDVATALFNVGAVPRAGRLFGFVGEALDQPGVAEVRRINARSGGRRRLLDEATLVQWVSDPHRRRDAAPIVRFFDDLSPGSLLKQLVEEKNPARAQLFVNMLDAHGAAAVAPILEHLATADAIQAGSAYQAALVAMLARYGVGTESRRAALELLGPMLVSSTPALRSAAVGALRSVGGREIVPTALKALEASAYASILGEPADQVCEHLGGVMALLVASGLDSAVAVVAEFATGARTGGFDRFEKSLRDAAVEALETRREPLSRRAVEVVAEALRSMAKRRFGLITGPLGVDADACRKLMRLIEDSPEPIAREVLELRALKKLGR